VEAEPEFRPDLYRGTARFYDRFWDQHLAAAPHAAVLTEAGFAIIGEHDFPTPHAWTIERLNGFLYSTSVLSKIALGSHVPAFEQDLRDRLLQVAPDNVFHDSIGFHYTLARLP